MRRASCTGTSSPATSCWVAAPGSLPARMPRRLRASRQQRPVGRLERGRRWVRRNPVVAGLLALLLLVLGAGIALSTWFARDAADQARLAEGKAQDASDARDQANALAGQLASSLHEVQAEK